MDEPTVSSPTCFPGARWAAPTGRSTAARRPPAGCDRGRCFPVGSELPKEAEIAEHFGVSLITVRQALRDLEADGLIRKRSAKPAVVTARTPSVNLSWNFKNFADMAAFTKDAAAQGEVVPQGEVAAFCSGISAWRQGRGGLLPAQHSVGRRTQRKAQITTYFPPDIGARFSK